MKPGSAHANDAIETKELAKLSAIELLNGYHAGLFTPRDVVEDVIHDYANYFFPYIRDQLTLPPREYYELYRAYGRMGFARYPLYHLYFFLGYLLGEKRFDALTALFRARIGRSPRFGKVH